MASLRWNSSRSTWGLRSFRPLAQLWWGRFLKQTLTFFIPEKYKRDCRDICHNKTFAAFQNDDLKAVLWIWIQWSPWIRIRIWIRNGPEKWKQLINFIFWNTRCSLLRAEGFSCSLDVLYGGLGIIKLQVSAVFFCQILVIKTLDPYLEPHSLEC